MQEHASNNFDLTHFLNPLGQGQKVKTVFFRKMVVMHKIIKLKGIKRALTCKQIFCLCTHPQPLGGVKRSKHFFF